MRGFVGIATLAGLVYGAYYFYKKEQLISSVRTLPQQIALAQGGVQPLYIPPTNGFDPNTAMIPYTTP